MTLDEMRRQVREVCGSEDQSVVPDHRIDTCIDRAYEWLAVKLQFQKRTETQSLAVAAGISSYILPPDLSCVIYVEYNTVPNVVHRLRAASTYQWDRDQRTYGGTVAAGIPQEFAILSRTLTLLPPPDAASVTAQPFLFYRGIFAVKAFPEAGAPMMSEMDHQLLVYQAAEEWMALHPSDTNSVRLQFCQKRIGELLPMAEARSINPVETYFPGWRVANSRQNAGR